MICNVLAQIGNFVVAKDANSNGKFAIFERVYDNTINDNHVLRCTGMTAEYATYLANLMDSDHPDSGM